MSAIKRIKAEIDRKIAHIVREIIAPEVLKALSVASIPNFSQNPLRCSPAKYFSQSDEDSIVLKILSRIDIPKPGIFLELGVGNGLENNTLILLAMGWTGAWVGGEALAFDHTNSRVSFVRDWITRENVVSLANSALRMISASLEMVQVASIDLDGNDFHIVKELLRSGLEPDLFIVEYNAKFPPPLEFVMQYDAAHEWKFDDYFGASLQSWENLLSTCGYQCVACNSTGLNAFFVNKKHSQHFADVSGHGASAHYVTGRYVTLPLSGPPTSPLTVATLARYQNSP